jgi:hypothetical protein
MEYENEWMTENEWASTEYGAEVEEDFGWEEDEDEWADEGAESAPESREEEWFPDPDSAFEERFEADEW